MQDREQHYEILRLKSPWSVTNVALKLKQQQVDVFVNHPSAAEFCCPKFSVTLPCNDHTPERQWRHLDSCQFKTLQNASVPRVDCPEHGVKRVSVPWAEKGSRFTILCELFAIQVLLATQTVTGAMCCVRNGTRRGQLLSVLLPRAKLARNRWRCRDWGPTRKHSLRAKTSSPLQANFGGAGPVCDGKHHTTRTSRWFLAE